MRKIETAILVTLVFAVLAVPGCGSQEEVCVGDAAHYVLVPMTSRSDIETTKEVTPAIADEVAERVADSCGEVSSGIGNNRPITDLVLTDTDSKPRYETAVDRTPVVDDLRDDIREELNDDLLAPLAEAESTPGSPTLTTLAAIARQAEAFSWGKVTIVLPHDGLMVERSPQTGTQVVLGQDEVPQSVLDEWLPSLKPLRGDCLMVLAAGAESRIDDDAILRAQDALGATMERAGIGFVATRSGELPAGC